MCGCTTVFVLITQYVAQKHYGTRLLLMVVMNKLLLPTYLNSVTFLLQVFSWTCLTLNGSRPWKWTEGIPTIAQARLAALWLFHCSVTVSLFCHLTCMSFALCISRVRSSFPLPSPVFLYHSPLSLSPWLLSILPLIFPDKWCYFLLFTYMYFCISCILWSVRDNFRFIQEITQISKQIHMYISGSVEIKCI